MGLSYNESKKQWEWEGDVRGLVNAVGSGDARLGFVVDKKSGAKISMNISGTDDEYATEPFYVESSNGENLFDAGNRKEVVNMLMAARKGEQDLDMFMYGSPKLRTKKPSTKRKSGKQSSSTPTSVRGIRR